MNKEKLIDLDVKQLNLLKKTLKQHIPDKTVWAYGSRVTWKASTTSDIDLAVFGCNSMEIDTLKEALEESDLLISVDIMNWEEIPEKFKTKIKQKYVVLQETSKLEGWQEVKLGDVCDVRDGTHDSPKQSHEGKYLVTSRHIKNGKINFSNAYKISIQDFEAINKRSKVDKWDILFSMIGTIAEIAVVDFDSDFAIKNVGLFKTKDKDLAIWIKYYLKSTQAKNEIHANLKGSTQQYITLGDLRSLPILLPPLPEQKAIAEILSSLDDKIDLLHRQNKTLEDMAQTLFRQWFIEEADEGWEEKPLSEIMDIAIGRTPPRKESQWFSSRTTDIKWISIKDMAGDGIYVFSTSECLTQKAIDKFKIPVIPENTVILSFKMTLGRVKITTERMLSNEAIAHFKFNSETPFSKEYLYLYLKNFRFESLGSTSSIVTAINSTMIKEMLIAVPDQKTMDKFKSASKPIFQKIFSNQSQISTLENLRDTLLPKLMSGEIRIKF